MSAQTQVRPILVTNSGEEFIENKPRAANLTRSMRHLDYDNLTAIADLIDNAIDAKARNIWVSIENGPQLIKDSETDIARIIVADDGYGMDIKTLNEALRLGSDTPKNAKKDLGLYGMGLVTASISMGKYLSVTTKTMNGDLLNSTQDVDLMMQTNDWIKTLGVAKSSDEREFKRFILNVTGKSGTVVIISKIDNCTWVTVRGLKQNLLDHLGRIFRYFLKDGVKIYVNGEAVKVIDPINDEKHTVLCKDKIELKNGTIDITVIEIEDEGKALNKGRGYSIGNQGFYVLRNHREVLAGEHLGIYVKHTDKNGFRAELKFPATLDAELSANFSKRRIVLPQSLRDKVGAIVNPFIKQIASRTAARQKANNQERKRANLVDIEQFIISKMPLLKRPLAEKEVRHHPGPGCPPPNNPPTRKHSPRVNLTNRKVIPLEVDKMEFRFKRLGTFNALYEAEKEGRKTIIYLNEEHPFYKNVIEEYNDIPGVKAGFYILLYSLGTADLITEPESTAATILEAVRHDSGYNLAHLSL